MAIDLQKLEKKFNALFEDENAVADFEKCLKIHTEENEKQVEESLIWNVPKDVCSKIQAQ